jgi:hypothetical protein
MISAALEADLRLLSALSGQDEDIEDLLRGMFGELTVAIPSAVGMSLTVHLGGQDVTLTALPGNVGRIGASILFPLGPAPVNEGTCMVFYAATPGAFVDLAADLGWATGLSQQAILLDQHLLPPDDGSAVTGLRELSIINQAIGMLIERGETPEAARAELERLAECGGSTVQLVAAEVMHGIRSGRAAS